MSFTSVTGLDQVIGGVTTTSNNIVDSIENTIVDTERTIGKTVTNVSSDLNYSGRFVAKNVVALADNTQDNIATIVDRVRKDIVDTVQVGAGLLFIGGCAFIILFGDKLFDRGIRTAGLEIL